MSFPNNECGILTIVNSDEPVQSPFKLGNSKWCSVSIITTHRKFKRLAKALIRLRVCAGWSESSLVAHITLLEISCRGSFQRRDDARGSLRLAQDVITSWRNVIRIVTSRHGDHAAACLKELLLLFKLLMIEKIHQSYGSNMTLISTKLASSRFTFTFCIFSMSTMTTTYFSTVELGS